MAVLGLICDLLFWFAVLGMKPRAVGMLSKCPTTGHAPSPFSLFILKKYYQVPPDGPSTHPPPGLASPNAGVIGVKKCIPLAVVVIN